ncbi:hypothetical protein D3C79_905490 [compost metagenome]
MALEVNAHDHVPVFFTEADEHAVAQHAGVVDQHMHFTERRQCRIDDALRGGQGGDVVAVGDGLATVGANLPRHILCGVGANIVDHHVGPLRGERQGVGATESAAGPGDDHGAVCTDSHV